MVILSILMATATVTAPEVPAAPSAAKPVATMRATARFLVAQSVTASDWTKVVSGRKQEVIMRDSGGQWIKLRLIENE